jgi:hypothetical protein
MSPRLAASFMLTLGLAAAMPTARAEGGPFGLGLIVGSPTGLSGKVYFNKMNALDFGVGEAFINQRGFHLHVDYLWHPVMLAQDEAFFLPLYLGVGGRFLEHERHDNDEAHLGVRGPIGILFDFKRVPIDVFLELAVIVDFIRESDSDVVDLNAAIGVRYYF